MGQLCRIGWAGPGLVLLGLAAACVDGGPVGPESGRRNTTPYTIEGLDVKSCQNGREYPDCEEPTTDKRDAEVCYYWMDSCGGSLSPYGGGSGTPSGTETAEGDPPFPEDDATPQQGLPDCSQELRYDGNEAYCKGQVPDSTRDARIRTALDRMAARGLECAKLADAGRRLLTLGNLRVFDPAVIDWDTPNGQPWFSGIAPFGGDFVAIEDRWTDQNHEIATTGVQPKNLQFILAHELDHHLAQRNALTNAVGHMKNPDGSIDNANTLHSRTCSGL